MLFSFKNAVPEISEHTLIKASNSGRASATISASMIASQSNTEKDPCSKEKRDWVKCGSYMIEDIAVKRADPARILKTKTHLEMKKLNGCVCA